MHKIKFHKIVIVTLICLIIHNVVFSQTKTTILKINIKTFGAKGNGKTNDFLAFKKAAEFINARKGNVLLNIPKGVYLINTAIFKTDLKRDLGEKTSALYIENCENVQIIGEQGANIIYDKGQKFGSFSPQSGLKYTPNGNFTDATYRQDIGAFIYTRNVVNLKISNLMLDGNIQAMEIGGAWGDTGIQLIHDGIICFTSVNVFIKNVTAKNFGRDGIMIGNVVDAKNKNISNNIVLEDCAFLYNGRQGLSWIGGSGLTVNRCKFNYTGKNGVVSSMPSAGVDVEAEWGLITNGVFNNCEVIGNHGVGFLADSGPSDYVTLNNCTLVGSSMWSLWLPKPYYVINNCNIYGSVVQGHIANTMAEATKFNNCNFTDLYKGKNCYGNFLVEFNGCKRMQFNNCNFTANTQKLMWLDGSGLWTEDEKPSVNNCNFTIKSIDKLVDNDYLFVARTSKFKNCNFNLPKEKAKMRGIFIQNAGSTWDSSNKLNYPVLPKK